MRKTGAGAMAHMAAMEERSKASTSGHAEQMYSRNGDTEAAGGPSLSVVTDAPEAQPPEAPKKHTSRTRSTAAKAKKATDAPRPSRPAQGQGRAPSGSTSSTPAKVGPTPMVPPAERRKYTIDIPPALRDALLELLIRDVEADRKVAQWQHADGAITHFLPEPTDQVPDFGDEWTEFGIALRMENRKRAEILKLRIKSGGRSRPYRNFIAEAIRRYIEALAPDLVEDVPG